MVFSQLKLRSKDTISQGGDQWQVRPARAVRHHLTSSFALAVTRRVLDKVLLGKDGELAGFTGTLTPMEGSAGAVIV